ncbi:MAG: hypothetical protein K6C14_06065 [Eubacterium sp.]|nr:hypothetical protein [Eubacterium sp.]
MSKKLTILLSVLLLIAIITLPVLYEYYSRLHQETSAVIQLRDLDGTEYYLNSDNINTNIKKEEAENIAINVIKNKEFDIKFTYLVNDKGFSNHFWLIRFENADGKKISVVIEDKENGSFKVVEENGTGDGSLSQNEKP